MKPKTLLAAALAVAASGGAHAAASGSAAITGFTWSLVDLAPDDGIAPALVIGGVTGSSTSSVTSSLGDGDTAVQPVNFATTAAALNNALGGGTAATFADGARVSAALASGVPGRTVFLVASGTPQNGDFVLTPHTTVTFSAWFEGAAAADANGSAYASGAINVLVADISSTHQRQASATGSADQASGELHVSFANASDQWVSGHLNAYAQATLDTTLPVPEPGRAALLAAGLAALAWRVRAQRRGAGAAARAAAGALAGRGGSSSRSMPAAAT